MTMRRPDSKTSRRRFLAGIACLGASAVVVGCGDDSKTAVVAPDPAQDQQLNEMEKYYEKNPPGTAPAS